VPEKVFSDRGTQFTSSVWDCMCSKLGIAHHKTTAYHPQANGLLERLHRRLKEALRARGSGSDWLEHLPFVMLGIRAAPKEEANVSSAEAAYGVPLALPGGIPFQHQPGQPLSDGERAIPSTVRSYAQVVDSPPRALLGAEFVLVRKGQPCGPLGATWEGPYKVLECGAKTALPQIGAKQDWFTVDRLKPFISKEPVVPAEPARRGRPKGSSKKQAEDSLQS